MPAKSCSNQQPGALLPRAQCWRPLFALLLEMLAPRACAFSHFLLAQTIMKIIKYSADALLSGPLCGLLIPADDCLEVTDCFPTYTDDLAEHQAQMLRSLREVNKQTLMQCGLCLVQGRTLRLRRWAVFCQ